MKIIEKKNGQIFEAYTSRKEFAELVNVIIQGMRQWDNEWIDDDSSLTLNYKDGTELTLGMGDTIPKTLRLHNIIAGWYSNTATDAIYNYNIVENEHYNDWEVEQAS